MTDIAAHMPASLSPRHYAAREGDAITAFLMLIGYQDISLADLLHYFGPVVKSSEEI